MRMKHWANKHAVEQGEHAVDAKFDSERVREVDNVLYINFFLLFLMNVASTSTTLKLTSTLSC